MSTSSRPMPQPSPVLLTRSEAVAHEAELTRLKRLQTRYLLGPEGGLTPADRDEVEAIGREHAMTAARIVELESLLRSATVLEGSGAPTVVAVGVEVDVRYVALERTATYHVTAAALPGPGMMSMHSPIGQALMGRTLDDRVEVELPNGQMVTLVIVGLRAAVAKAA